MSIRASKLAKEHVQAIFELTPLQEGLLFHYLQNPTSAQYHVQVCLHIEGQIEEKPFQQAWEAVIQSNELLRTVFRWQGLKRPVQIVLKKSPSAISYQESSEQKTSEIICADYAQAFDLQDVPFRVILHHLSTNHALLLISHHHILYDGWSNGILLREFFAHYTHLIAGRSPATTRKLPFKVYVEWLKQQDKEKQATFWRSYLQELDSPTRLPMGKRSETVGNVIRMQHIVCPTDVKQRLDQFCRDHQVTQAALLYCALGILLQKYGNTDDSVFGTTVSGRTAAIPNITELVGLFINTLPLRVRAKKQQSVLNLVRQVQTDMLARMEFEGTALVDIKEYSRLHIQEELFDTIMVIENYPLDPQTLTQDAPFKIRDFSHQEMTNYDLTIVVNLLFNALEITFQYRSERFTEEDIQRLQACYLQVLTTLLQHPDSTVEHIEIISESERQLILGQFNQTKAPYPEQQTIIDQFVAQVEQAPDLSALYDGDDCLTYGALHLQSNRLAHFLCARGVNSGVVVGLCAERSLAMMVGLFAILKAGGVYLPLDPAVPAERQRYILKDSGAVLLLCQRKFMRLQEESIETFCLEERSDDPSLPTELMQEARPDNLAYLIYTSGSTGRPKGVLVNHRSLVNRLHWVQTRYPLGTQDVVLHKTNNMFDVSIWELLVWVQGGAALCLLETGHEANPHEIVEAIARYHVTTIHFVPSMFYFFLEYLQQNRKQERLHSLRRIMSSGEALPARQVAQFYQFIHDSTHPIQLINLYGPTESTIDASYYECNKEDGQRATIPIGRPIDNIRLYVLNGDNQLQPLGVPGELYIAGIGVAHGYINAPELTAQRFLPDPFEPEGRMYKTGDLVRWLPTGDLEYLGRTDYQVKVRGFRIELAEIETQLRQSPEVQEAVVSVITDDAGDDRLVAYFVPSQHARVEERTLRSVLATQLPLYMIPDIFHALEHLPLTPNGKIDRRSLAQFQEHNQQSHTQEHINLSAIERQVAQVWQDILGVEHIRANDAFFEIGGNSLKILRVSSRLDIPVTILFRYPTVRQLAQYIADERHVQTLAVVASKVPEQEKLEETFHDVAVIGMSARFPGANNLAEFWSNLVQGVESIAQLSDEELTATDIDPSLISNPAYVKAKGILQQADYFDAQFFGYSPKEAEAMDPQMRLLHEGVWEALEHAGYNPETYEHKIGLYAGSSPNFHWLQLITQQSHALDEFSLMLLNEKDFLSARVAYKLNLKGPSVTVQTACSTSLTAIHYAAQDLLNGHCDMAIAAGVSITYPLSAGYLYKEGMIYSPDGHCRAFDAQAQGTVGGNGLGVVVLKRLDDALRDGDHIHAVIKGSAINNDGFSKVGFTAPGIDGQAQVIIDALAAARVAANSIGYVEAHGTGTPMGDPIELEALKIAFTDTTTHCAIGSVKTNIGHLDAAAGVAGFIKTVLALEYAQLPPSLHFKQPTPALARSPFHVVTTCTDWPEGVMPRRAGVSSFGMGGSNAHVILEEAARPHATSQGTGWHILPLSAMSVPSLHSFMEKLTIHLQDHHELNLAELAYTLQVGRKSFAHRQFVVGSTLDEVRQELIRSNDELADIPLVDEERREIVFLFPGQGSQYANMGRDLYTTEPGFREVVEHCFTLVKHLFDVSLQEVVYQPSDGTDDLIHQTVYTQLLLFSFEYALAQVVMRWGIIPTAMIGHSLGEYVAACLAGVFSLEDALYLVGSRAKLMQQMPTGSMLSVSLSEQEVQPFLIDGVSIAAYNTPSSLVLSGPKEQLQSIEMELEQQQHEYHYLITSHAFHSDMMEPVCDDLYSIASRISYQRPTLRFISNVSGTWIRDEEAMSAAYWVNHLRSAVRFSAGVDHLLQQGQRTFIEIGPGRTLSELVRKHCAHDTNVKITNLCRHPLEHSDDMRYLLYKLGILWQQGVRINWKTLHSGQSRQRIPLPTYAFQGQRFWPDHSLDSVDPISHASVVIAPSGKQEEIRDWFYMPSWERVPTPSHYPMHEDHTIWLLFAGRDAVSMQLIQELSDLWHTVIVVYASDHYEQITDTTYTIRPRQLGDFKHMLKAVQVTYGIPTTFLHLWHMPVEDSFSDDIVAAGFYALLNLARVLGEMYVQEKLRIFAVTSGIEQVTGSEQINPAKATIYGFTKICALEYPNVTCRTIDIELPDKEEQERLEETVEDLLREFEDPNAGAITAYRAGYRWTKTVKPVQLTKSSLTKKRLRQKGTYLITGGLGGIGLAISQCLAEAIQQVTLILINRSDFPSAETWNDYLQSVETSDPIRQKILKLQQLEDQGARVIVIAADITNEIQMTHVIHMVEAAHGPIHGVVHAAGIADYAGMMQVRSYEQTEHILAPKVAGTIILDRLFQHHHLDFFVLCSSIGNIIYQQKFGQSGYNAANEFLDAYAHYRRRQSKTFWVSINWSDWQEVGMSLASAAYWARQLATSPEDILKEAISVAEGIEAFRHILSSRSAQIIVSPQELAQRTGKAQERLKALLGAVPASPSMLLQSSTLNERKAQSTTDIVQALTQIWQQRIGLSTVGLRDNFFDLGATSLDLVQVNATLKASFMLEIPLVALYEYPTIETLAAYICAQLDAKPAIAYQPEKTNDTRTQDLLKNTSARLRRK